MWFGSPSSPCDAWYGVVASAVQPRCSQHVQIQKGVMSVTVLRRGI
jgi:hypothetical protein